MSGFAAGVVLLALIAAGFVAWPLRRASASALAGAAAVDVRRADNLAAWRLERAELDRQLAAGVLDADTHGAACIELDRRLLEETAGDSPRTPGQGGTRTLVVLAIALPLAALLLYGAIGALTGVRLEAGLAELDRIEDEAERSVAMVKLLPDLESAARAGDADGNYRYLLARTYMSLGRYAEAASVLGELTALYPQDAGLLAQQAQALYLAGDRHMSPTVQALIDRAFAIDPAQVTLLGMVGMDRFQAGDYAGAIGAWEKLLAHLPPDAPDAAVIRDGIAMARVRAGDGGAVAEHPEHSASPGGGAAPGQTGTTGSTAAAVDVDAPRLRVSVRMAEGKLPPGGATVFVFARAVNGPPMPLAVARFGVADLPREVQLDDSMAMAPGMSLSRFPEVTVVARVSQSGTVAPQAGDLEGSSGAIHLSPGEQSVDITIDRVL